MARKTVTEETYFKESKESTKKKIPTEFDELLTLVSSKEISPPKGIEVELSHIQACLAENKFLPAIRNMLYMPLPGGPVGGMASSDLENNVEEFDLILDAALESKLSNSARAEKIVLQAKSILQIRKAWKSESWKDIIGLTAASALPTEKTLIQNEIAWANYEAHDRLWQAGMYDALSKGRMDGTGTLTSISYVHITDLISSVKSRRSSVSFTDNSKSPSEVSAFLFL